MKTMIFSETNTKKAIQILEILSGMETKVALNLIEWCSQELLKQSTVNSTIKEFSQGLLLPPSR